MITTTIIKSHKMLNQSKYAALFEQALLVKKVRDEVRQRYGSINGIGQHPMGLKKQWVADGAAKRFAPLNVNVWKECLLDELGSIAAAVASAKQKIKKLIFKCTNDEEERKRLFTLLRHATAWKEDKYLARKMRQYYKRGHNHCDNQINLRSDNYTVDKDDNGLIWLKVPSLVKGRRIAIPLQGNTLPFGNLRLILRNNRVEVHFAVNSEKENAIVRKPIKPLGAKEVGIDKGYTEAYQDSDGNVYGEGLNNLLSNNSDYLDKKYRARNKLWALAQCCNPAKADRIRKNNLGRKKLDGVQRKHRAQVSKLIRTATNQLFDYAGSVVTEDLSASFSSKKPMKKVVRRKLARFAKGEMAKALKEIFERRRSALRENGVPVGLHLVASAYTSQIDCSTNCFTGIRKGDLFYRESGEIVGADWNAAVNVLQRKDDPEIHRFMSHHAIKAILVKRTTAYRAALAGKQDGTVSSLALAAGSSAAKCELPMTNNE